MLYEDKLQRAMKWNKDQNPDPDPQDPRAEFLAEERNRDLSKEVEKGDMLAMILSGFITIFLPCLLVLLLMIGVGALFLFGFN